jgi:type IX secretion system PorP/SprF family membrane protein
MKIKNYLLFGILFLVQNTFSQEGIAVYTDYLTDNYYLIHPSMAGAANCAKLRATGRQQWAGQSDAPSLQTLSFNTSLGQDQKSGVGMIVFNDKNGYHSQTGAKLTYAHHLLFSRTKADLNMLSFGLSTAFVQSRLDETKFVTFDPIIVGGFQQRDSYFNIDLGASYHFLDFYTHLTVKNVIASQRREIYSQGIESDNLRKILWSVGQTFGNDERIMFEPSLLFQYTQETNEKSIDLNAKVYKGLENGKVWGGLSYRSSFDGAEYVSSGTIGTQRLQYITPFVGLNFKQFMVAYTYNHVVGDVKFDNAGYHQFTIGLNLWCKPKAYDCKCPAVVN